MVNTTNKTLPFKYALVVHKLNAYATNAFGKPSNRLLFNVSFKVPTGSMCTFIGHNGAGKTTTVKSCLGLRAIQSGKITINGIDGQNILARQRVGYIPEKGNIEKITARNFLIEVGAFYGMNASQTIKKVYPMLKFFELPTNRLDVKLNKLSSGQNKIITIIQAFLGDPYLIIADEPTDNLDPETRDIFWDFVHEYHTKHPYATFFLITHNLDEIEKYTDHLVFLDHGRIKKEMGHDRSAGLREMYRKLRHKWRI
ncbi:MAG: ABC transporter ATP-binding protein [Mycoplasmataceae bacterium]|nr:ABC transporter ATP-binding protein [Mycoplasmataceae bacterium]